MGVFFWTIAGLYLLSMLFVTLYCLSQLELLYYYKSREKRHATQALSSGTNWPFVTIQLPVYNEKYVIERLLENIVRVDYPWEKLEIQVLDDSTDETSELITLKLNEYKDAGCPIFHIRRENRDGFKAGALKNGMNTAKGEFIAIFDADFLPNPSFLKETIPFFENEKIGVVQACWQHINDDYSLITRSQAMHLNVHFIIEQEGRQNGGYFLQFNGTAGVWRRNTIEDAGGWQADTLTEDLDLSMRAQMKGWRILYLKSLGAPAELPVEIGGVKSQQFRWMKGGAETARKILPALWQTSLPVSQKLHATVHLLASSVFVAIFVAAVLSVPVGFMAGQRGLGENIFAIFLLGLFSILPVYYIANVADNPTHQKKRGRNLRFLMDFPLFLSLSLGLSLHNTIAVLQGFLGIKTPFIRTPKFNIKSRKDKLGKNAYRTTGIPWITIFECLFATYFTTAVVAGICGETNIFIGFHIMLAAGFGLISFYSVFQKVAK